MKIVSDVQEMQSLVATLKQEGRRIAFVPTMGFLHEGHATLLRAGRLGGDVLVLSIFVNPTQFGPQEDLDRYPRDLAGDLAIARSCGVDIVFTPTVAGMYPAGFQSTLSLSRLTTGLCGASRPGHFDGVAIVVTKLLNIVGADVAYFGEKDYQQLAVIRQMVLDLNIPVDIIGVPIVREADGLARSSRNSYLSAQERIEARCLSQALSAVNAAYKQGVDTVARLREVAFSCIAASTLARVDYLAFVDAATLEPVEAITGPTLVACAVFLGKTRLIDNMVLNEEVVQ